MDHKSKCKLLDENIGENLGDVGFGEDFLDTTSKAQFMKENKWCFKFKTSALQKTFIKMKRQVTDWEKILAKHTW